MPADPSPLANAVPDAAVERLLRPLARFLRVEAAGGVVLLAATATALALANSPAADAYHAFWHAHVSLEIGPFRLAGDLGHLVVNDGLMTVFFFVVGLEIKRELVAGELRDPRKAALPVAAALGGMVVPAALYLAVMGGKPGAQGWGVPMATDIAFVVGAMALLGRRVPVGLKVMLLSLAIADDIGAVLVIAVFYSTGLDYGMLALAVSGFAAVWGLKRAGVRSSLAYAVAGVGIWLAAHQSGVHPTVAGVALGLMTPAGVWVGRTALGLALTDMADRMRGDGDEVSPADLELLAFAAREAVSPLERLEHALHPWVSFLVMPLFALANAGVAVSLPALADPVALAVAAGLVLGKPVGVLLFGWLAVKAGIARLPARVTWRVLLGGGCLAGIGFTMSLFVAGLGLEGGHLAAGKVGTLAGSVLSAALGAAILFRRGSRR